MLPSHTKSWIKGNVHNLLISIWVFFHDLFSDKVIDSLFCTDIYVLLSKQGVIWTALYWKMKMIKCHVLIMSRLILAKKIENKKYWHKNSQLVLIRNLQKGFLGHTFNVFVKISFRLPMKFSHSYALRWPWQRLIFEMIYRL